MKPKALTAKEFDRMVRDYERNCAIPSRLRSIETWIEKIAADPTDVRGGDVPRLRRHVEAVRRHLERDDFLLALDSLRGLEGTVRKANSRVTAPLIETGKAVRAAAQRGGRRNPQRDVKMYLEWERRRPQSGKSDTALAEDIGRDQGLKRRAAVDAIKRGKKIVQSRANCSACSP